jgi:hypothetical protein
MRKEFVEVETIEEAAEECPWAAEIVEAEGGFWFSRASRTRKIGRRSRSETQSGGGRIRSLLTPLHPTRPLLPGWSIATSGTRGSILPGLWDPKGRADARSRLKPMDQRCSLSLLRSSSRRRRSSFSFAR